MADGNRKGLLIIVAVNMVCFLMLALIILRFAADKEAPFHLAEEREYANTLRTRELYPGAVAAYDKILNNYGVDRKTRGNISFIIGDIYREKLRDYENALVYYLKTRQLLPEDSAPQSLNSHIVSCLEHLERSLDARHVLEAAVLSGHESETDQTGRPDEEDPVIARIAKREVRRSELNHAIQQLPPSMQADFTARDKKVAFLRQYLAGELLYNAAKRKGYENDEAIRSQLTELEKMLVRQKYIQEEIDARLSISEADLKLYFLEHQDDFKIQEGEQARIPEFEEAADRVEQAVRREKEKGIYEGLLQRLMKAEKLEIYEERL